MIKLQTVRFQAETHSLPVLTVTCGTLLAAYIGMNDRPVISN